MFCYWRKALGSLCAVACLATTLFAVLPANAATRASIAPGDVIQGQQFSTLYFFAADGMRYVFPNEKTYFTWFDDFTVVDRMTDSELGNIQIGGNVTYKPGVKMVKINTDPKTYAVERGGVLRWIETEQIASILYGEDWQSLVDDIPDAFFANYTIGAPIDHPDDFILKDIAESAHDINEDKGIDVPLVIIMTDDGYSPIELTVEAGQSVRFINDGIERHTVTAEDLLWGSGTLAPGAEFVHTFESVGTYPFFDSYNSRNSGAVYVISPSE